MELLKSTAMDKLSYEIFSILESKFLFDSLPETPTKTPKSDCVVGAGAGAGAGKVRVLSIDGAIGAGDGHLAAVSLAHLESSLRSLSGDPTAHIADFFDIAAGSGAGGVLAAMLFTRGTDGKPLFTAADALAFLSENQRRLGSAAYKTGLIRGIFGRSSGIFRRTFGEATLRDTVKPVLIPCFDLDSGAPFVFSRADAIETDAYDFKISAACAATCAARPMKMSSVDGRTKIVAVGGGVAMENPTSAAITHVLNNKMEFPFANGVEDLLVVSLGSVNSGARSAANLMEITGSAAADTVDEAVSMAFGQLRTSNYVRIQANEIFVAGRNATGGGSRRRRSRNMDGAEEILTCHNVETVMFRGRKISELSNADKLNRFASELIEAEKRRKSSPIPMVLIKRGMSPRISSATTCTATTGITSSSLESY